MASNGSGSGRPKPNGAATEAARGVSSRVGREQRDAGQRAGERAQRRDRLDGGDAAARDEDMRRRRTSHDRTVRAALRAAIRSPPLPAAEWAGFRCGAGGRSPPWALYGRAVRHLHGRRARRHHHARRRLRRRGGLVALLAVLGPGLLAGLSDDDPAGITTYSILGADHGYRLLWVLAASTAALILFHELGARIGRRHRAGLAALVRERYGARWRAALCWSPLLVANLGTACAEFAGVAAGARALAGVRRDVSVPIAAVGGLACSSCAAASTASSTCCSRSAPCSSPTSPRASSRTRTGARPRAGWSSPACRAPRRRARRRGRGRHDARALGAGVHPVLRRRQALTPERPALRARRRRRRAPS